MIALAKGALPEILRRNAATWTKELLAKINAGEDPSKYLLTRYSHHEIKDALLVETSEKCAYCESKFRHVTYGDIEHIIPKSIDPALRFEWTNLTVACDVCNTNKSDVVGLVDPFRCDPTVLFTYYGPMMWARHHSDSAVLTELRLDLNRGGLVERRRERIEYLREMLVSAKSKRADIRDAMINRAFQEVNATKPFSACGSSIINQLLTELGLLKPI